MLAGWTPPTDAALAAARGGTPEGTVGELQQKHLLALNLRRAPGAALFTPRAYFLPCASNSRIVCDERSSFLADHVLSQAAAVLSLVDAGMSPATASVPSTSASTAAVAAACRVCSKYLQTGLVEVSEEERAALMAQRLGSGVESVDLAEPLKVEALALFVRLQAETPVEFQMQLLRHNAWIVKPSTGALGRGITFLRGIDDDGECVTTAAGKEKRPGGDDIGCVVQKYVESPHLIDPSGKPDAWTGEIADGVAPRTPSTIVETAGGGRFKYSIRYWIEVLWSSEHPEAWFYEPGYLEFADRPYSEDLKVPDAHITNLSMPRIGGGPAPPSPWPWDTETYRQWLLHHVGTDIYVERLLPEAKRAAALALSTIRPSEPEGSDAGKQRWKRFGLDFLIDKNLHVWLIEFNYNPGMSAARGRRGDMKRELVQRFYKDEAALRGNVLHVPGIGGNDACHHVGGDSMDRLGAAGAEVCTPAAFSRLQVPSWDIAVTGGTAQRTKRSSAVRLGI